MTMLALNNWAQIILYVIKHSYHHIAPDKMIIEMIINPFMPNGLFYRHSSDRSISSIRDVWLLFIEIPVLNANSVDPDQMPHCAASDLGLHCLPMSLLWDVRLKGVKNMFYFCTKIFLVGILWYCLTKAIPVSTHRIHFGA